MLETAYVIRETDMRLFDGDPGARIEDDKRRYLETSCRVLNARIREMRLLPRAPSPEEEVAFRDALEMVIEAKRLLYRAP